MVGENIFLMRPACCLFKNFKAAVVMSHNLSMDAAALNLLQSAPLEYLALLGPESRRQTVLELAGLSSSELSVPLHSPAGLALGGELPESLALSILAQCHAVLHGADGRWLSEPQSGPLC
jgi:xanthine dehydrogenase accessory factor